MLNLTKPKPIIHSVSTWHIIVHSELYMTF